MSGPDPTPLPHTTILSTKHIPQPTAHDFLGAYLDRATTDPALQPNAGIGEHGPVSRTTAAAPNIILHNLKRVQAGLAGEVLGRDLALAKMKEGAPAQNGGEGAWEDKKQFEQEQELVQVVAEGEDGMDLDGDAGEGDVTGAVDKEERKRRKKERRKAEKKAKLKGKDE
ncbi:uncharacterized protein BJX67DRAFT_71748 [Aspergillus lucknowensis]|uniref:Uncharacterized protein n=1 Tax=Aspergillus lucknowensis TaxID=176173 RepID=A0ABR4LX46_9EURO